MATPLSQYNYNQANTAASPTPNLSQSSANTQVQESLESFTNPNSQYLQNARRRGLEFAAQRGGINSSIAAGAAERSALEAAVPLAQQAINIQQNREAVDRENWLSQQNFNRALQGQVFTNSLGMLNAVQEYALNDPELYTPEVASGYSNFFQRNLRDILGTYFKDLNLGG